MRAAGWIEDRKEAGLSFDLKPHFPQRRECECSCVLACPKTPEGPKALEKSHSREVKVEKRVSPETAFPFFF